LCGASRILKCVECSEGPGEPADAAFDLGGRGILVKPVNESVAAGNENHRRWHEAYRENGVMVGATDTTVAVPSTLAQRRMTCPLLFSKISTALHVAAR